MWNHSNVLCYQWNNILLNISSIVHRFGDCVECKVCVSTNYLFLRHASQWRRRTLSHYFQQWTTNINHNNTLSTMEFGEVIFWAEKCKHKKWFYFRSIKILRLFDKGKHSIRWVGRNARNSSNVNKRSRCVKLVVEVII